MTKKAFVILVLIGITTFFLHLITDDIGVIIVILFNLPLLIFSMWHGEQQLLKSILSKPDEVDTLYWQNLENNADVFKARLTELARQYGYNADFYVLNLAQSLQLVDAFVESQIGIGGFESWYRIKPRRGFLKLIPSKDIEPIVQAYQQVPHWTGHEKMNRNLAVRYFVPHEIWENESPVEKSAALVKEKLLTIPDGVEYITLYPAIPVDDWFPEKPA